MMEKGIISENTNFLDPASLPSFKERFDYWDCVRKGQASKHTIYLGIQKPSSELCAELVSKRMELESKHLETFNHSEKLSMIFPSTSERDPNFIPIPINKPPARGEWDWDFKLNCRKKFIQCIWKVLFQCRMMKRLSLIKKGITKV